MRMGSSTRSGRVATLATAVALAVAAASAVAQEGSQGAPAAAPGPAPGAAADVPRDYVIGPGDMLAVGVFGVPEMAQTVGVSNSGKVHLTHLGIIKVAGRTAAQLQEDLAALLRDRGLVRDPWVIVEVTRMRAHPVYVLGEVMTPGQFQISSEMYLSDLVTLSMGFNDVASPIGYLYRRAVNPATGTFDPTQDPDTDEMEAIPIDFHALQTGADPSLNMKLRGGDILYVPERRKEYYFIIGDVHTAGLFEIEPGRSPLLLSQAMARAGGPTRTAKPSKTLLVRYDASGARQEMEVDFKALMQGRQPDIPVRFGDVIFVPGSRMKTAGLALLDMIPGVVEGRVVQR